MDRKDLFTAGIFLIGFLSLLLVSFNAMLAPIKKDIQRVESSLGSRIDRLDARLDSRIDRLGSRIDRLDSRIDQVESRMKTQMDRMNSKLDKLILLQVEQNAHYRYVMPKRAKKKASVKPSSSVTRTTSSVGGGWRWLAVTVGIEPTTYSSGNCRSIQLSYVT